MTTSMRDYLQFRSCFKQVKHRRNSPPEHLRGEIARSFDKYFETRSSIIMSRKATRSISKNQTNNYTFVNLNVSAAEKQRVEEWAIENEPDYPVLIDDLLVSGHKISLSWDDYNDCFSASITCRDQSHMNGGLILTGKAGSSFHALSVVLFKHYVSLNGGEWPRDREVQGWG